MPGRGAARRITGARPTRHDGATSAPEGRPGKVTPPATVGSRGLGTAPGARAPGRRVSPTRIASAGVTPTGRPVSTRPGVTTPTPTTATLATSSRAAGHTRGRVTPRGAAISTTGGRPTGGARGEGSDAAVAGRLRAITRPGRRTTGRPGPSRNGVAGAGTSRTTGETRPSVATAIARPPTWSGRTGTSGRRTSPTKARASGRAVPSRPRPSRPTTQNAAT